MSERLFTFLEQLKIVPHDIHKQLSSFFVAALDRPLCTENGLKTFEYSAIRNLWSNISSILIKEDDASLYLTCLDRMYTLAHDEDDKDVRYWWVNFWINVGRKLPQLAAHRIEQLLIITIDRKDFTCLSLLPVSLIVLHRNISRYSEMSFIDHRIQVSQMKIYLRYSVYVILLQ
jgi:hypothetical protein